jgi:O-antigen/teichoic acid export membrane protein
MTAEQADETILAGRESGAATVRGSVLRAAGYGLSMLLSLVSVPFLVRHLGIAEFGYYTTVLSLVAVAGGLSEAGLTAVAVRAWTTDRAESRTLLMRDLLGLRLVLTLAGGLAVVGFAVIAGYPGRVVTGTALAGAGLLVLAEQQACTVPLQVELRAGWLAAADVMRQAVTAGLTLALVAAGAGLVSFLAIPIPAAFAALVLTAWPVIGRFPLFPAFHGARWRALLRETLPVAVAMTVHHLYLRVVMVIMSLETVAFETGLFAASYRITEVLMAIPFLVGQTTLPVLIHAAEHDRDRLRYATARLLEAGMLAGAAVVVGVVLGAPLIISVLAGDAGAGAVPVLRIQAVVVLLVFLTITWQGVLFAVDEIPANLMANLIGLVVAAGSSLALIGPLGARGGAIGAVAGELSLMLTSAYRARRAVPGLGTSATLPLRVGGAAAVACVPLLLADLPSIVAAVLGLLIFAGAALAFGAVGRELRSAVRDVLPLGGRDRGGEAPA